MKDFPSTDRTEAQTGPEIVSPEAFFNDSERRAFIQRWIARNRRRLGAGLGLVTLALPLLATAQQESFVDVSGLDGVSNVVLGPNGTATITLANGQSIVVPASQVQVIDGTILISASAAEFVAEAAAAAVGAPAAMPGGAAIGGALAAGVAVAAVAASGSGDGTNVTLDPLAFGDVLGISGAASDLALSGTVRRADDEATVRVTIRDAAGNEVFNSTTPVVDGAWSTSVDSTTLQALDDGTYTLLVELLDEDGEVDASSEQEFTVDYTPPVIAIDAISGDDVLNAAERGEPLTISGTTDAEDGQEVTVTLNGVEYTATVQGGAWSVIVPAGDLANLPDGAALDVEADVQDIAGNEADTAVRVLETDFTAPDIAIDPVAGNDVITLINQASDLEVTGTTDAEDGQIVTVTFAGVDYASDPVAGGTWTATIPQAVIEALDDEAEVEISARVTDAAGNPAETPARTLTTDFSQPALSIDAIAGDDIINAQERSEPLEITGGSTNLEEGRPVTLIISGPGIDDQELTGNTGADGSWSATLANPSILSDGAYTITATAENAEGVEAVPAARDFAVDTVPPQVGVSLPVVPGGVLNAAERDAGVTVEGTTNIEDEQPVEILILGDVDFGAGVGEPFAIGIAPAASGAWSFFIEPSILQQLPDDGSFSIQAIAENLAGNRNMDTGSATTDFTPPDIGINDIAGNNVITLANQGSDLEITGTTDAEDGQIVTVTFAGVDYDSDPVSGGTWTATIPQAVIDALDDEASIAVSARVSDAAGNPSTPAQRDITTDFSQPTITIEAIAEDNVINIAESGAPVTVSGNVTNLVADNPVVNVVITGGGLDIDVDVPVDGAGDWSTSFDPSGLADGDTVTVTVTGQSDDGTEAIPGSASVTVDFTVPTVSMDVIADDGVVNIAERDAGITITGTSTAEEGQIVTLTANGTALGEGAVEADGSWSVPVDPQTLTDLGDDADLTVTAEVSNAVGNPAPAATRPLATDYTPPTLVVNAPPWGLFLNAAEAEAGQTVTGSVTGNDGEPVSIQIGSIVEDVTPDGDGNWSLDLLPAQLQGLAEGETSYSVSTSDAAGNTTTVEDAAIFTVDFTPPEISDIAILVGGEPIGEFLNKAQGEGEVVTVTGTVTGNDGEPVIVSINGVQRTATQDGDSFSAEFEAGALSGLTDGDVSFEVATEDAAGNPATASSDSFTVDYTPPVLVIDAIGDDGVVDQLAPLTVTGTAAGAEGQEVTVTLDGVDYTDMVDGDGNWSVEIPGSAFAELIPGETLTFTANVSDAAGNPADEQTDDGAALYLGSDTYLTEVNRIGDEIRIGVFIDPMAEFEPAFFALDEAVSWDTNVVFWPRPGAPATAQITPQPAYQPEQLVLSSPTSPLTQTNAGSANFTGLWVAEVDEDDQPILGPDGELLVPAVPFPLAPMLSFSLTSVDPGQPEVVVVTSQGEVGGPKALFIGTDGDDSITAGNIDTVIRGRGGDDEIDVSAGGVNTIFFEPTEAENGTDLVTGFSLAANTAFPDRIAFAGLDASELRGTGEVFEIIEAGDSIGANTGFVVFTTALMSDAEGLQALEDLGLAANDIVYVMAGDGTNAELVRIVVDGDGDLPAVNDIEVLAEFQGIGDLAGFSEDNILGFSPLPT